jgi:predicted  nucleic acid-binding Zn-ribbon protein
MQQDIENLSIEEQIEQVNDKLKALKKKKDKIDKRVLREQIAVEKLRNAKLELLKDIYITALRGVGNVDETLIPTFLEECRF